MLIAKKKAIKEQIILGTAFLQAPGNSLSVTAWWKGFLFILGFSLRSRPRCYPRFTVLWSSHQKIAGAGIVSRSAFSPHGQSSAHSYPVLLQEGVLGRGSGGGLHEEDAAAMLTTLQCGCDRYTHSDLSRNISAFFLTIVCVISSSTQGYEATRDITCSSQTNESAPLLLLSWRSSFPSEIQPWSMFLQLLVKINALSVAVVSLHS